MERNTDYLLELERQLDVAMARWADAVRADRGTAEIEAMKKLEHSLREAYEDAAIRSGKRPAKQPAQ